jgi:hypothetical protein
VRRKKVDPLIGKIVEFVPHNCQSVLIGRIVTHFAGVVTVDVRGIKHAGIRLADVKESGTWYRCLSCSDWVFCATGNHHPWCMMCVNDQFDWNDGRDKRPDE